jgi:hypothetical protein
MYDGCRIVNLRRTSYYAWPTHREVSVSGRFIAIVTLMLAAAPAGAQTIDTATAFAGLREAATACARDAGALWGRSFCGPIALVEPATRLVIANDSVPGRPALRDGSVYVTTAPDGQGLANTSVEWSGQRWAMILLPLPMDQFDRIALVMHESFHREQKALDLEGRDPANNQLDQRDGRLWFRLELRALAAALDAVAAGRRDDARAHTEDALLFRARRRAIYSQADTLEPELEMQEGLAEYNGDRFAMLLTGESAARVAQRVRDVQSRPTFVRSFAYGTGPALGLLLDEFAPKWRREVAQVRDPARMLAAAVGFRAPKDLARRAEQRATDYGGPTVMAEENARDSVRRGQLADYRRRLLDGPTVTFRQSALARGFNPNQLIGFDDASTIYPTGNFGAEWGSLAVSKGGALVANDFSWLRLGAPAALTVQSDHTVHGDGWVLTLDAGWSVVPASAGAAGSYEVVKRPSPAAAP